jgi:S-adenosylmethionine uptake transporter
LLRAFAATDVSALAPFRYVEMIFAGFFGFLIFHELPTFWTLVGAAIIVPSTFAIAYYETHSMRQTRCTREENTVQPENSLL